MAVNWTREQKQVIEGREKSLLVSAAAGSGKTAVLVERIIKMITDEKNNVDSSNDTSCSYKCCTTVYA